jgi:hypothetical protein
MRPRYLYLYIFGSPAITVYCKNPNPNVIRSSMNVHMLLFLPIIAFLVHSFLPKITFISALAYFQQVPNTGMWLVPSNLAFVCFVNIPGDHLELLPELCCLCLSLRGLLNLLISSDHFLLQSLHAFPLLFGLDLGLFKYQFHLFMFILYLLQFDRICAWTRLYLLCNANLQYI